MRSNLEFSIGESLSAEEDSEPLPITSELIQELVDHIKDLWHQHYDAKSAGNYHLQNKLETALHFAYHHLNTLKDMLDELALPPDLRKVIEEELWFSCNHLYKVIRYLSE